MAKYESLLNRSHVLFNCISLRLLWAVLGLHCCPGFSLAVASGCPSLGVLCGLLLQREASAAAAP